MNPQWNTPPNGDFASYVERLSAQAALPKRAAHEGDHGLDVGITPAPGAQGAAQAAAQRRESSNGDVSAPGSEAFPPNMLKAIGAVGALVLLAVASGERARAHKLFCVGFAAESENLAEHAKAKRERKGIPLLVGNIGPLTFGQDDNALLLVDAKGTRELPRAPKLTLARELMTEIAARLPDWRL